MTFTPTFLAILLFAALCSHLMLYGLVTNFPFLVRFWENGSYKTNDYYQHLKKKLFQTVYLYYGALIITSFVAITQLFASDGTLIRTVITYGYYVSTVFVFIATFLIHSLDWDKYNAIVNKLVGNIRIALMVGAVMLSISIIALLFPMLVSFL